MVTSDRSILVHFNGDIQLTSKLAATTNSSSPGSEQQVALSSGNNTVSVPSGSTALTVVKPAGNAVALKLKGVSGDTGVTLHLTDPDSISLDSTVTAVVINAASAVTLRLIWS